MLPRWHILFGAIFAGIVWLMVPQIGLLNIGLIFFSFIFIDFDHYAASIINSRKMIGLRESFEYHRKQEIASQIERKKGIRKKSDFHLFHTVEFHILIGIIGIFWNPAFYIFIGMIFHSLLDLISLIYGDNTYAREYFLFNWIRKKVF
jgi:hypothetical protein